jgi:hypothetical protein
MSGYRILVPDSSQRFAAPISLPLMDAMQALGNTPVVMDMASVTSMYRRMRYESHGCYEIFGFYVRDLLKKESVDFGLAVGLWGILEDGFKKEAHNLVDECSLPNLIYFHERGRALVSRLDQLGARNWQHTYIAVSGAQLARELHEAGHARVLHIPPATSQRLFFPQDTPPANAAFPALQDPRLTEGFDVSFVGSYTPQRERLLTAVLRQNISVAIFGDRTWQRSESVAPRWRGPVDYLRELNTVYNSSKVNLDLPDERRELSDYTSCRLFDCLASGGFIAAPSEAGHTDLLECGHELACYEDEAELAQLVSYYLADESARQAIAMRGMRRVLAEHTWTRRLDAAMPQLEMHLLQTAAK